MAARQAEVSTPSPFPAPEGFLLSAGFFGGIAMAIYSPLLILINRRFLPEPLRPTSLRVAILTLVSLFYITFALTAVATTLPRLLG